MLGCGPRGRVNNKCTSELPEMLALLLDLAAQVTELREEVKELRLRPAALSAADTGEIVAGGVKEVNERLAALESALLVQLSADRAGALSSSAEDEATTAASPQGEGEVSAEDRLPARASAARATPPRTISLDWGVGWGGEEGWQPNEKWGLENEYPPQQAVAAPVDASMTERDEFAHFASACLLKRDFTQWVTWSDARLKALSDAVGQPVALSRHSQARFDERSSRDDVGLSDSLHSSGGAAYRAIAFAKRLVLHVPPWRFNFNLEGSLLSLEKTDFTPDDAVDVPVELTEDQRRACRAAVQSAAGKTQGYMAPTKRKGETLDWDDQGVGKDEEGAGFGTPLPPAAAAAARVALSNGPVRGTVVGTLRVVTTIHVLVFSMGSPVTLITMWPVSFSNWRDKNRQRAPTRAQARKDNGDAEWNAQKSRASDCPAPVGHADAVARTAAGRCGVSLGVTLASRP